MSRSIFISLLINIDTFFSALNVDLQHVVTLDYKLSVDLPACEVS